MWNAEDADVEELAPFRHRSRGSSSRAFHPSAFVAFAPAFTEAIAAATSDDDDDFDDRDCGDEDEVEGLATLEAGPRDCPPGAEGAEVAAEDATARLRRRMRSLLGDRMWQARAVVLTASSFATLLILLHVIVAPLSGHRRRRDLSATGLLFTETPILVTEGHSGKGAKTLCACQKRCNTSFPCLPFPEVHVIYLPHIDSEVARVERLSSEYNEFVSCKADALRKVSGVDPRRWPMGSGRYETVQRLAHMVPPVEVGEEVFVGADEGKGPVTEESPWWVVRNLAFAEVNALNQSTWVSKGSPWDHHCGCTLSHFVVWMDAHLRWIPGSLIVSESDGYLDKWWGPMVGGDPSEFEPVVRALLEEAPEDWDVIFLDKGKRGVAPSATATAQVSRRCLQGPYNLYPWTGRGMAGAALYMVSQQFLTKIPWIIHVTGLEMVDAWLGHRCDPSFAGQHFGGQLNCFTVEAGS